MSASLPDSPPPGSNPQSANFASTELAQSLKLLPSNALLSYQIRPANLNPPGEARASLELLERGDDALVGVTTAGWKVHLRSFGSIHRMTPEATARDYETFDSLENLVAYLSPEFDKTRVSSLMSQLQQIALERGEEPAVAGAAGGAESGGAGAGGAMEVDEELLDGDD